jgi:eukaryotic-like serine/threonine-protein kinase
MNKELSANIHLSHYRIVRKIGAGGMGEVYLAEDTKLRRRVALKVLPESIATDKERLRRFEQEAFAASGLNHPNILTIYEFGAENDAHFLASEFVAGETLRERMTREPLDLRETLDVALQVAAALNAAHEAGIVHRDIKPENVMLRDDRLVKVLDFGLAKLVEKKTKPTESEDETRAMVNTAPGIIMGTAAYMSPEQARGKDADSRSDIWSLGVCLYEMLARRAPFAEETVSDTIAAILKSEPAPLDESAPPELNRIIRKALQKNRDERYQTIKDFLLDLKNLKKELEFAEELERSQIPHSTKASNVSTNQPAENATAILPAATETQNSLPPQASSAEYLIGEAGKHKLGIAFGSIILLALVGLGYWYFYNRAAGSKQIESIAVMPFVNESGNADAEYLSDGMTETLIKSLSQIPNLNVKPRSSVFRYKGKDTDLQTIAGELNVQAILTGRVVQRGDQLTLSLELVDVSKDSVIWTESYNRKQSDIVSLQSEIAKDVSTNLKAKLSGAAETKVTKTGTADPEAYQAYLKGRFHLNKRTIESLKQAAEFYRQAVEKDPNYALAYSGLAETYAIFPLWSIASSRDSMPQAKAAALRALEIDDSLAEAHAALGLYLHYFEFDRSGGEKEMRRAIELNPNYATAHEWLAVDILTALKRFDEAVAEIRRAEELDPLSSVTATNAGYTLVFARRYTEAIAQLKRVLNLDPNYAYALYTLGYALDGKGMYAEAIVEYRKSLALNDDPFAKALLARALAKSGKRGEALQLIEQLKSDSAKRYVANYCLAIAYAALGEKEEALVLLEKDIAERSSFVSYSAGEPALDDLRDDPRFRDLLRRMNLPE